MDSEERIYQSTKNRRRNRSSNKLPETPKKCRNKQQLSPQKKPILNRKLKQNIRLRQENMPSLKRKSPSKSTRKRVETLISQKIGQSLSLTKNVHNNTSSDSKFHRIRNENYRSASEELIKNPLCGKKKKKIFAENPSTMYYKSERKIRFWTLLTSVIFLTQIGSAKLGDSQWLKRSLEIQYWYLSLYNLMVYKLAGLELVYIQI